MKRVLIMTKAQHAGADRAASSIAAWLAERRVEVVRPSAVADPSAVDLAVVLGGDGTLLGAAREVGARGVPILGVNMGGLGFLTAVGLDRMYEVLDHWLAGEHRVQERMTLEGRVFRDGREVSQGVVLNDLVINKAALARILDLPTFIDGRFLTTFRADGLIISTPTGSTAYNLAAGGPILVPGLQAIVLAPICPFTLTNRPLVLDHEARIEVRLERGTDAHLTYDGQVGFELADGDRVEIGRAARPIRLVESPLGYFEILRTKLGWGGAAGGRTRSSQDV
ncbi:MAG: NAD(+)/NADH kinase [Proteobacteria bacterium]|nr:NAD(+)/NADH kinase [Pseudomonadota bacterium]MBU1741616.1 NAD(+)/NADH kinase [Pseudomonadota bacterium]